MGYSIVGYANTVVRKGKAELVNWPRNRGIPFGEPGLIPGGAAVLGPLVNACKRGEIHFVAASPERIELARRCKPAVLPSTPTVRKFSQEFGRFPRNDLGRARARPVKNPLNKPLKKQWQTTGAITRKLLLDEPIDEDDEIVSDWEMDSEVEEPPESDPIEEWDSPELAAEEDSEDEIEEIVLL